MSTSSCKQWRLKNPMKYSYNNLKNRSKQRGKYFDLTFEQFEQFAVKNKYIQNKGRAIDSYTIDCIEADKGYTVSNIRILPHGLNSSRKKILEYDWQTKTATVVDISKPKYEYPDDGTF